MSRKIGIVARRRSAVGAIERLESRTLLAGVEISEFLAANNNGLADEDGQHPDWIELHNTDPVPFDLTGWHLTDDSTDLDKWQIPATTTIPANGYLVIFASGKDRHTAGQPLHTNFSLEKDGEYLGLVMPDGTTVTQSFDPYPGQKDDVSYGNAVNTATSTNETLVGSGSALRVISPTAANAATDDHWREIVFPSESSWLSGTRSVGFDRDGSTNGTLSGFIGRTLSTTEMPSTRRTAYVRYAFNLANKEQLSSLTLTLRFDDGFIAFLNNKEVERVNFGEFFGNPQPAWNSAAGAMIGSSLTNITRNGTEATTPIAFDLTPFLPDLVNGQNVLAFHVVNGSGGGENDLLLEPVLTATRATAPVSNNYMVSPTPAADNGLGTLGFVNDTHFSDDRYLVEDISFPLEITTTTVGAEIRYTLDGSRPTASTGTVYSGPITISKPTSGNRGVVTVRVAAFKPGYTPTNVDTHSYVFLSRVIQQSGAGLPAYETWGHHGPDWAMDSNIVNDPNWASTIIDDLKAVPTLSVVMNWNDLFDGTPMPGTPEATGSVALNPRGIYIQSQAKERAVSLEYFNPANANDRFQIDGSIEIQGHASSNRWGDDKLSFQVKFKDRYGPSKLTHPLFAGTPHGADAATSFDQLILDAGYNFTFTHSSQHTAATFINDQVMADLQNQAGGAAMHGKFVHLYLNGLYWGIYNVHERPDDSFAQAYFGGSKDDYDIIKHNSSVAKRYTWVEGGITAENTFQALLDAALEVNIDPTNTARYQAVQNILDVDSFIDYMILHYYGGSTDWPQNNWYASRNRVEAGAKWRFHEWDQEHAISLPGNQTSSTGGPTGTLHLRLINNPEYKQRFNDRVQKLMRNEGLLTQTAATAAYNARKTEIDRAIVGESARWGDNRMVTSGTRYTPNHWLATMSTLTGPGGFFATRTNTVLGYFSGVGWLLPTAAPNFSNYGGSVSPGTILTMTNPGSGTIYYTTDGSDPRAVGGAIAGTPYGGPITLNQSVRIRARVNSGSNWSPEIDATFVVGGSLPVRISEVHYHPAGHAGVADAEDLEFIELLNTGVDPVNLQGVQLTQFTSTPYVFGPEVLAPGGRIIVARNPAVFQSVYGSGANLAPTGYADANLSNGGERIVLLGPLGETLQDFTYDDISPWPTAPDGSGPSLEIIDPLASPGDPANWRASSFVGGSPGAGSDSITSAFRYESGHSYTVQFSRDMTAASFDGADLSVQKSGGPVVHPTSVTYDDGTRTATFTFATPLPDGNYTAALTGGSVTDASGNALDMADLALSPFFVLAGDANHNGVVDVNDLNILAMNWGQSSKTFAEGNFDYSPDGLVNENDLTVLSLNWQKTPDGGVLSGGAPLTSLPLPGSPPPAKNPPPRTRPPQRQPAQRLIDTIGAASSAATPLG